MARCRFYVHMYIFTRVACSMLNIFVSNISCKSEEINNMLPGDWPCLNLHVDIVTYCWLVDGLYSLSKGTGSFLKLNHRVIINSKKGTLF